MIRRTEEIVGMTDMVDFKEGRNLRNERVVWHGQRYGASVGETKATKSDNGDSVSIG